MAVSEAQYNDDGYDYDPEAQEQGQRELALMPGVYEVQALIMPRNNQDGEPIVNKDDQGNEWPQYTVASFEVLNPTEESGRFTAWQKITTKPRKFGDEPYVSEGAVVLRSIDADAARNAKSFGEAVTEFKSRVEGGPVVLKVSTGLTGTDTKWAEAQIAEKGLEEGSEEYFDVWKKAKLNTKDFMIQKGTKTTPAKYAQSVKSKLSGNTVKAKVKIAKYIPSDVDVEFGVGKFPPK